MSNAPTTSQSGKEVRVGLIGLDTSHVAAFSKLLNKADDPEHLPGARVVAGFPGGSKDFDLSINRVEGFTNDLRDKYSVRIVDSPEAVAETCDVAFITAVDGRTHLETFKRIIKYKRPTFLDKPVATSSADAKEIFRLGAEAGIPVMSCSSLRYADAMHAALAAAPQEIGAVVGCDVFGPMAIQPTQPGLFWYGVHMVEILSVVMGTGCKEVKATTNDDFDLITATWSDGRIAVLRGSRKGHGKFGLVLHGEKGPKYVDLHAGKRSWYGSMLEAILRSLPNGKSDIPAEATLEIVRFIEAANESRKSGKAVPV